MFFGTWPYIHIRYGKEERNEGRNGFTNKKNWNEEFQILLLNLKSSRNPPSLPEGFSGVHTLESNHAPPLSPKKSGLLKCWLVAEVSFFFFGLGGF